MGRIQRVCGEKGTSPFPRTEFPAKANFAFKAVGVAPPLRILSYRESKSVVFRQG